MKIMNLQFRFNNTSINPYTLSPVTDMTYCQFSLLLFKTLSTVLEEDLKLRWYTSLNAVSFG